MKNNVFYPNTIGSKYMSLGEHRRALGAVARPNRLSSDQRTMTDSICLCLCLFYLDISRDDSHRFTVSTELTFDVHTGSLIVVAGYSRV
jgi:hypothetical protein